MKWGVVVLIFQALVTLAIGIIFLAQVISLDFQKVVEYRIEVQSNEATPATPEYIDLKHRYASASYILLFVSIIEIIIILKIMMK